MSEEQGLLPMRAVKTANVSLPITLNRVLRRIGSDRGMLNTQVVEEALAFHERWVSEGKPVPEVGYSKAARNKHYGFSVSPGALAWIRKRAGELGVAQADLWRSILNLYVRECPEAHPSLETVAIPASAVREAPPNGPGIASSIRVWRFCPRCGEELPK